jgi:hypothetical protein
MDPGMSASPASCRSFYGPLLPPRLTALPGGLSQSEAEAEVEEPPRSARVSIGADSPDDVLALAASAGNARAYAIISRRYASRVRAKLHHWIGPHDIDDHVQDVFLRLFEQLPRLRDPGALRGFLVGITLRIACTELRRRRRSRMRLSATGELPEPRVVVDD